MTSGTLNASHVRTKRAAFTDESMSSTPASDRGWLPTTPTACPPSRAKPQTMFSAQRSCTSRNSPSSITRRITSCMSYGLFGLSGISVSRSASSRSTGSVGAAYGDRSRLFCGRNESSSRASSRHASSSGETKCATPDFVACVTAPPRSSNVTSSPVTVFTTSGPVMNMYDEPSTMNTKSVIAGE